jgi:hypothetical protein
MASGCCAPVCFTRLGTRSAILTLAFAAAVRALTYTVPAGCTTVIATLTGGGGGASVQANAHGGSGQIVIVNLPVTPGSTLNYVLGGAGHAGTVFTVAATGGTGGGATAVYTTNIASPLAVAGGGGGGGNWASNGTGAPGGDAGSPSGFGSACSGSCGGGGGGTASAGGSAGAHSPPNGNLNGQAGAFQNGGNGATDTVNHASDCTLAIANGWGTGGQGEVRSLLIQA